MNKSIRVSQKCRIIQLLLSTILTSLLLISCKGPGGFETPPIEAIPTKLNSCDMLLFDDLPPGKEYVVGNSVVSQSLEFVVQEFVWSNGTTTPGGHALVEDHGGDIGIFTNNVNLHFILNSQIDGMQLFGGYHGGNSNITINGEFRNFDTPSAINGDIIGGVPVTVFDLGNDAWLMAFRNVINEFSVGGQELWIGDACLGSAVGELPPKETPSAGECVRFESLQLQTKYQVGDTFSDMGTQLTVMPFIWSDGTSYNGGFAEVKNNGNAGGSGYDIWTNNVNIDFNFHTEITELQLLFGTFGGNLNIEINGVFVNFDDPSTITSTTIDGVNVISTNISNNEFWSLTLSGTIKQFAIGGQEFAVDDVCLLLNQED